MSEIPEKYGQIRAIALYYRKHDKEKDSILHREDTNNQDSNKAMTDAVIMAENTGVAAAVSWFKNIRLDNLLNRMRAIDMHQDDALSELEELTRSVEKLIESNRGGDKGIHGFIGERAQVYLSNAWALINGEAKTSILIDDNGISDYLEKGINIQQKACRANGFLGLDHVMNHKAKYPQFDGKYQIPKDFYNDFERLKDMPRNAATKMTRHDWNLWEEIQNVRKANIEVEPMRVTYEEIQRENIYDTIDRHTRDIRREHDNQIKSAIEAHKPSLKAFVGTAATSSILEGTLSAGFVVLDKRLHGKSIKKYNKQDFKDVGIATAEGSARGAVRGAAIYLATNYTPIPGVVAGGAVTIAFDGTKAIYRYNKGVISKEECIDTITRSTVKASAGTCGALIGSKICPIPIVGAAVGGFVFSYIADKAYTYTKTNLKCGILNNRLNVNPIKQIEDAKWILISGLGRYH